MTAYKSLQNHKMNRRDLIKNGLLTAAGLSALELNAQPIVEKKKKSNFTYCLNTSTIMKQKIGLVNEIKTAAKVGFDGIEIWMNTLETYVKEGGKLPEIRKLAEGLNIRIEDSIGFATWIVDDETKRTAGLEQLKREMDMLAQIGCKRIAAPPFGATNEAGLNLYKAAERYTKVLELGKEMGVLPQLELWGFSKNMHLFGETLLVASQTGHPNALILPDVYHFIRGGSPFNALEFINGSKMQMFHVNDYPTIEDPSKLTDAMRVMPGDGVAPLNQIFQMLQAKNTPIVLSIEIFNEDVWKMDATAACTLGLAKMKAAVAKALS
jgi:sugar phosphate isomerase/epimerase